MKYSQLIISPLLLANFSRHRRSSSGVCRTHSVSSPTISKGSCERYERVRLPGNFLSVTFNFRCNIHHITTFQKSSFFSNFLVPTMPTHADNYLPAAMMNMPIIAVTWFKSTVIDTNLFVI